MPAPPGRPRGTRASAAAPSAGSRASFSGTVPGTRAGAVQRHPQRRALGAAWRRGRSASVDAPARPAGERASTAASDGEGAEDDTRADPGHRARASLRPAASRAQQRPLDDQPSGDALERLVARAGARQPRAVERHAPRPSNATGSGPSMPQRPRRPRARPQPRHRGVRPERPPLRLVAARPPPAPPTAAPAAPRARPPRSSTSTRTARAARRGGSSSARARARGQWPDRRTPAATARARSDVLLRAVPEERERDVQRLVGARAARRRGSARVAERRQRRPRRRRQVERDEEPLSSASAIAQQPPQQVHGDGRRALAHHRAVARAAGASRSIRAPPRAAPRTGRPSRPASPRVPPPGPAIPVMPIPRSAPKRSIAPSASAAATSGETAPWRSISAGVDARQRHLRLVRVRPSARRARTPRSPPRSVSRAAISPPVHDSAIATVRTGGPSSAAATSSSIVSPSRANTVAPWRSRTAASKAA